MNTFNPNPSEQFKEWMEKVNDHYQAKKGDNEQLAKLIVACPTSIYITGFTISPHFVDVPGESKCGRPQKEELTPSFSFELTAN